MKKQIKNLYPNFTLLNFIFISSFLTMLTGQECVNAQTLLDPQQIIQNQLRTDQDKVMDTSRQPLNMLNFIQPKEGMKVLDIFSGGGYTAQLMAIAVGQTGQVVAMNLKLNNALQERLLAHPQTNVIPVVASITELAPGNKNQFDIITIVNSYHDMVNASPDIAQTNQRIFELLKPGGVLIIRDHAAATGAGKSVTKTLHRIEPASVVSDFESTGLKKVIEGDFLKNPKDTKDVPSSQFKETSPEGFIFKFIKP